MKNLENQMIDGARMRGVSPSPDQSLPKEQDAPDSDRKCQSFINPCIRIAATSERIA
jgi:hypothetical protein